MDDAEKLKALREAMWEVLPHVDGEAREEVLQALEKDAVEQAMGGDEGKAAP